MRRPWWTGSPGRAFSPFEKTGHQPPPQARAAPSIGRLVRQLGRATVLAWLHSLCLQAQPDFTPVESSLVIGGLESLMSSQQPAAQSTSFELNDVQNALFELHSGLMSLKASLQELAQLHDQELAACQAQLETDKLLNRLRRAA